MNDAAKGTNTPMMQRPVGWAGASAITFGIAILEFVKELLLGRTLTHAAYESSVFLAGGLILGLVALVAKSTSAATRTH